MSKLEELLQGVDVEWKALGEVSKIIRGVRVTKKDLIENGKYPVVSGGTGYMGFVNEYNREENSITIAQYGTAGFVKWQNEKFWANDVAFTIYPNNEDVLLKRFLYYFLINKQNYLYEISNKIAVPFSISKEKILQIKIPIPCPDNPEKSLEIQQEIVRVLDELTSLTNQLTTELETERQNRKKQFEFFREQLFRFEKGETEWKSLGDVTKKTKNIRWNDTNDIFRYIDLSSVDKEKRIVVDTSIISSKNAPSRAQKIVFEDDIIFATTRPTQMRVCFIKEEFSNQIASTGFCVLRAIKDIILPKWIFHQLTSNSFKKYLEENQAGIAYPAISDSKIKEFKIPIPVLAEQERIVKLLDQFDATHTAIEEEITKEIKLRTQQYEYYREKLLTFPEN